ncbi:LOW QUALITY PROTEIN: hypothetical protein PHMEG_00025321 [Phytophthora megakarya]|uniref:CCHC-type domain-containing protein n=1 Tax=Phytophthora megakarya TaxID=4795 RepID=A0A225VDR2_9STRA|nr:LOW QUALITY PROTEIN: hypothetical protein PHMEG_00025321 [Phytophthora megakarya]
MTGGVAQNMQFAHALPAGMVFAAQGGVAQPDSSLGVQVTEAVLPVSPMPANPDDVVMSESGRAAIRGDDRSRTSWKYAHRRKSSPSDDSPSESESSDDARKRRHSRRSRRTSRRSPSRSTKSEMTGRSRRSRYSATSGASQVALNAMRSTQDMLARMESKQDTTQAQLNQRVDQAFQAIQMLAARPGVVKSTTIPNVEVPTVPVHVSTGVAEATPSKATSHEVVRALKAAETQFEERWQRREAEAEKAKESWTTNLQKSLNDQWESVMSAQMQRLQEEITSLKEARNQDQKANRRSKNVRGTSSSNTRATSTEVQGDRSTVYPRLSNAIKDDVVHSQDTFGDSAFAAQLQLTLPNLTETKYEKGDVRPKEEQGSRIAKTSGSRVKSRETEAKSTGAARSEDKELPKKELREKPSRQDEDPSEPSSSGESSEEDDSSSDSDSSSDGMPSYTMVTNAKGGSMLTLRTFTNTLDDFDEKQSLTSPMKFLNMTIQAGWTEQMKIYEFKTKMSPAARNWMGQIGKRVRTNWGRLAREFKREYCKSRVSDSEKYYTMKQYKYETALAFLYRLNLAAERVDVKFRKSERRREQHIKRFIKNLTDMSLRSTLQKPEQQEEVNASGSYSTRSPPNRDFRADNVARGGMRQRNSNRAYVAQDDEGAGVEQPAQVEQDVGENDAAFQELSAAIQDAQILDNPNEAFLSKEELIHEVYRIMNNVGWKPANPNARSGPSANPRPPVPPPAQPAAFQGYQSYNNPDRLEFCEKCKKFGHRPEKCWTDMVCGQCHRRGHPSRSCMTKSCPKCEEYRDGHCEEWKAFQEIKKLVLQGGLADLPSHAREDTLNGKDDSEEVQLNH